MKTKYKIIKYIQFIGFLVFSLPVFASNPCIQFKTKPKINTVLNYGDLKYQSIPKRQIISLTGLRNPLKTMGLTLADFQIKFSLVINKNSLKNSLCLSVGSIDFDIGYEKLYILIDDKYKSGSCEYEAISNHEKEHVKIYQNELKRYGKLLIEEVKILIANIDPIMLKKGSSESLISDNINHLIRDNDKLNILKNRLEKSIIQKNHTYDNEDEYLRVKKSCESW